MRTSTLVVAIIVACTAGYFLRDKLPEKKVIDVADADGTIALSDIPLQNAIKQVRGNGQPILVSFEDPNCRYCAEQDERLSRMDNITLYTFIVPILSNDSVIKSQRIWCAADPASAWNDWMLKRQSPAANRCNTTALDRNIFLFKKKGFRGVPQLLQAK